MSQGQSAPIAIRVAFGFSGKGAAKKLGKITFFSEICSIMPSIRGFGVKIGRFGAQDQRPPGLSLRGRDLYLDEFVEDYIDFKQKDGTVKDIYDHLILGRQVHKRQPRWSLIRNVLHWIN